MIIKKAEYIISGTSAEQIPNCNYPEFVFIGRSNVGKSSFINSITNRKNLAYTTSKPGKTITLNFYNVNDDILLVDVPGYGYAQKLVHDRLSYGKMIESYLNNSKNLKVCFLIVDARHKPTNDDVLMYDYLKHYNHKVIVVATKIDKISKNELTKNINEIKKTLSITNDNELIKVSSVTKQGIEEVHAILEQYIKGWKSFFLL